MENRGEKDNGTKVEIPWGTLNTVKTMRLTLAIIALSKLWVLIH
jgi:hypothetical protein